MRILLVEPNFFSNPPYTRYPPLALLKLSAFHRNKGDEVQLIRREYHFFEKPELIYITSLFTYTWKEVHKAIQFYRSLYPQTEILVGGVYASLFPDKVEEEGGKVHQGILEEVEDIMPDYSWFPEWKTSLIFSSRGCIHKCPFCAVPKIEPNFKAKKSISHLIPDDHKKVVLWDNNFLASPFWKDIIGELGERKLEVDFNQGLDVRVLDEEKAFALRTLKMRVLRISYDRSSLRNKVQKAIQILKDAGFKGKRIIVYVLYNFDDIPEDFLFRLKDLAEWEVVSYPQRYEPLDMVEGSGEPLVKNKYISPNWDVQRLEMVAKARRVFGSGGTFPPHEGIKWKFLGASSFEEAFSLWPKKEKGEQLAFRNL